MSRKLPLSDRGPGSFSSRQNYFQTRVRPSFSAFLHIVRRYRCRHSGTKAPRSSCELHNERQYERALYSSAVTICARIMLLDQAKCHDSSSMSHDRSSRSRPVPVRINSNLYIVLSRGHNHRSGNNVETFDSSNCALD